MGQRPGAADPLLREETCHCHQPASQMFRRLSVMFKMHPCEGWIDLRATIIFFITHGALHGLPCFTVVSQFPFHKSLTNGRVYQISGLCEHFFFAYEPLACGNVFTVALFATALLPARWRPGKSTIEASAATCFMSKMCRWLQTCREKFGAEAAAPGQLQLKLHQFRNHRQVAIGHGPWCLWRARALVGCRRKLLRRKL